MAKKSGGEPSDWEEAFEPFFAPLRKRLNLPADAGIVEIHVAVVEVVKRLGPEARVIQDFYALLEHYHRAEDGLLDEMERDLKALRAQANRHDRKAQRDVKKQLREQARAAWAADPNVTLDELAFTLSTRSGYPFRTVREWIRDLNPGRGIRGVRRKPN